MSKLKERDGKLIFTAAGKLATECALGCIVEFDQFVDTNCDSGINNCTDIEDIAGVPFLVPPQGSSPFGYVTFEGFTELASPITCIGPTVYNYVYIYVEASISVNDMTVLMYLTQTEVIPPGGVAFLVFDGDATYANPQNVTADTGCAATGTPTVATVTIL